MLLLIASMAVVAGCGGSSDDDGPTKDEYIASADKICTENDAEIEAMGKQLSAGAGQEEALALVKSDLIPSVEKRTQDLEALPRPSGDEDELEAYYQALDDGVSTLVEEPKTIFGDDNPFEASNKLAKEYGFKECGDTGGN